MYFDYFLVILSKLKYCMHALIYQVNIFLYWILIYPNILFPI